jgi:excisionase family DNA binding protein
MDPVGSSDAEPLDLQAAADSLGVHYQTAYRWVRSGRLRARRVRGRYTVSRHDLDALVAGRSAPRRPPAPNPARMERAAQRVHDDLVSGDEAGVRALCRRLTEDGAPLIGLIEEVLAPALARIGQAWHDGELTISAEHRAAAIVERVLGDLAPNPRGRRRGTAVVAAVSGDRHVLPTVMAAVALRADHWTVHHLGADLPPAELVGFCAENDVDVAVLSVTNTKVAARAARTAVELRSIGVPAVVGAPGRSLSELLDRVRDGRWTAPEAIVPNRVGGHLLERQQMAVPVRVDAVIPATRSAPAAESVVRR